MPPDAPLMSRSARPWYATDSGRAGVALSVVTISVLAVGLAVIHGASSAEPSPTPTRSSSKTAGVSMAPQPSESREDWIVLKGSAPTPTQLPATTDTSERTSLPSGVAERPADTTLERY